MNGYHSSGIWSRLCNPVEQLGRGLAVREDHLLPARIAEHADSVLEALDRDARPQFVEVTGLRVAIASRGARA